MEPLPPSDPLVSAAGALFYRTSRRLFPSPDWYCKVGPTGILHLAKKKILLLLALSFVMTFGPLLRVTGELPLWLRLPLAVLEIAASLLITLILCEKVHGVNYLRMHSMPIRYNYWIAFALFLVFYILTSWRKLSLVLTYILVTGFSVLNYSVYQFRGEPIITADIYVMNTALDVAGDYTLPLTFWIFAVFFFGAVLIFALEWLPREKRLRGKKRLIPAACSAVFVAATFYLMALTPFPENKGRQFYVVQSHGTIYQGGTAPLLRSRLLFPAGRRTGSLQCLCCGGFPSLRRLCQRFAGRRHGRKAEYHHHYERGADGFYRL